MTTKYRAFQKDEKRRITGLIYLTPNPNFPDRIVASIIPISVESKPDGTELNAGNPVHLDFPFGTNEDKMVVALLKATGVTNEDLEFRIGFAKMPA